MRKGSGKRACFGRDGLGIMGIGFGILVGKICRSQLDTERVNEGYGVFDGTVRELDLYIGDKFKSSYMHGTMWMNPAKQDEICD